MNIKFTQSIARRSALLAGQAIFVLFLLFAIGANGQTFKNVIHFGGIDPVSGMASNDASSIAKDDKGNIYVAGLIMGTVDLDPAHPGVNTISQANGNAFLAKYDSTEKFIWGKSIATINGNFYGIGVDAAGYIYIAGNTTDSPTYFRKTSSGTALDTLRGHVFFAKYDNNGNYQWAKSIHATTPSGVRHNTFGIVGGMGVSLQGDVYLTCASTYGLDVIDFDPGPNQYNMVGTTQFQGRVALAKYNTNGNLVWAHTADGIARSSNTGGGLYGDYHIQLDNKGYIYLGGSQGADTLDFDFGAGTAMVSVTNGGFLAKYDTSGKFIWANGVPVTAGIAVDPWGNIYTAGWLQGPYDFDPGAGNVVLPQIGATDLFIAKYSPTGSYIWAKNVGSTGASLLGTNVIIANAVALGTNGNIYITGYFTGDASFNPVDNSANKLTATFMDMFLAQYDACGNLGTVGRMGAIDPDIAVLNGRTRGSMITTPAGYIYVAGTFAGPADFDPGTATVLINPVVPLSTGSDAFIAKYYSGKDKASTVSGSVTTCNSSYTLNGVVYTTPGTYTQVIPAANGCADSTVIFTLTFSTIVKPVITVNGFLLGVAGTYSSYQWYKDGSIIAGETNSTYMATSNGQYRVLVTNNDGCTDTSDVYAVTNVGVANIEIARQINIYPNPANKVVYVKSPVPVDVQITDMAGRLIRGQSNATSLPVTELARGIYLIKIVDKNGTLVKVEKIVKE